MHTPAMCACVPQRSCAPYLVSFLIVGIKDLTRSNGKVERFILVHSLRVQSIMGEESGQQQPEAATVRKSDDSQARSPSLFSQRWPPGEWYYLQLRRLIPPQSTR